MAATIGAITLPSPLSFLQLFPAPRSPSWERPRMWPCDGSNETDNRLKLTNSCAKMNAELRPSSRFKLQDRSGSQAPDTGAYPDGPPLFIYLSLSGMCCCQTYVQSSQPDSHIVPFVSWQCVPDSVVPFVHVLQRHGGVVLDNLGQGGALVKDHSKDDKL